jgi:hypothetical protein
LDAKKRLIAYLVRIWTGVKNWEKLSQEKWISFIHSVCLFASTERFFELEEKK